MNVINVDNIANSTILYIKSLWNWIGYLTSFYKLIKNIRRKLNIPHCSYHYIYGQYQQTKPGFSIIP